MKESKSAKEEVKGDVNKNMTKSRGLQAKERIKKEKNLMNGKAVLSRNRDKISGCGQDNISEGSKSGQ